MLYVTINSIYFLFQIQIDCLLNKQILNNSSDINRYSDGHFECDLSYDV